MRAISELDGKDSHKLSIGHYTLDDTAEAFLNGNKFFQRHAVIVGSTGSGKSWTTARLLEQVAALPNANGILFDIHGEYKTIKNAGVCQLRIAGPNDVHENRTLADGVIYLPYWLLGYEEMVAMLIDRSEDNAPNQAMVFSRSVISAKKATSRGKGCQGPP